LSNQFEYRWLIAITALCSHCPVLKNVLIETAWEANWVCGSNEYGWAKHDVFFEVLGCHGRCHAFI
jgi:hypothetical protein